MTKPWFKRLFGVLGGAFLAWGVIRAWQQGVAALPSLPVAVVAVLLSAIGIATASFSWSALFSEGESLTRLRSAFVGSQIGKHLPLGGIAQAVGQTELSLSDSVTRRRASHGFVVHGLVQVTSALLVVSGVALDSNLSALWRIGGLFGLFLSVLLLHGGIESVARFLANLFGLDGFSVPSRANVVRSVALCLVPILAAALAFALILNDLQPSIRIGTSIPQFAVGWLAGYLAVPFPAGLGVREAVLTPALGLPLSVVVAASLAHRIITLAVEGVLAALVWRNLGAEKELTS